MGSRQHGWGMKPRVGQARAQPPPLFGLPRHADAHLNGERVLPLVPMSPCVVEPYVLGLLVCLAALSLHFSFLSFTPAGCERQRC